MNLPKDFTGRMIRQLGPAEYARFEASLLEPVPVSLRLNRRKLDLHPAYEQVPWCRDAYYLAERPVFASDPLWHAGAYYVQEASSMMLEAAFLKVRTMCESPLKVLDLCAAPGGKSSHILSLLEPDDVLVSNEVIRSRVPVLFENISKQGYPNVIITNADSQDFGRLGEIFDIILVDAPCSGEGLFRKDMQAIQEWSPENVHLCESRQKRILEDISKSLKQEGFLIYSTCTYNPGENSIQTGSLVNKGFTRIPFELNGKPYEEFQSYPHEIKGEGFYLSVLQKQYTDGSSLTKAGKNKLKAFKAGQTVQELISPRQDFYDFEGQVLFIPANTIGFYLSFISNLYCYSIGARIGLQKQQLFSPSEHLPFSLDFNRESLPSMELGQAEALSYLNKQVLPYKGQEKGYVSLVYRDVPIGLGKFAGNRINNLFPNEWKLRKPVDRSEWFNIGG